MAKAKPPKIAIASLGCPKNLVDSEKILAHLAEGGCIVGAPMNDADVVIINTCGLIAPAVAESLEVIEEARRLKDAGKVRRVVVAGCLVNRMGEGLFERAEGIDAIVGVNDSDSILSAVLGDTRVSRISASPAGCVSDAGRFRLTPTHTAYLRIAEGCSRRCTFCTIPSIRGPFRSKRPAKVLVEARELLADGAVELNVIAQDTTNYGRDLGGSATLANLLRKLDKLDGVEWIRLLYAYPRGFDDDLIDAVASCEHVVGYVNMPLQHISDAVLKRMGRRVTRKQIERLLRKLASGSTGSCCGRRSSRVSRARLGGNSRNFWRSCAITTSRPSAPSRTTRSRARPRRSSPTAPSGPRPSGDARSSCSPSRTSSWAQTKPASASQCGCWWTAGKQAGLQSDDITDRRRTLTACVYLQSRPSPAGLLTPP